MPLSMYQASVPVFQRQLGVLSQLLHKGLAHAQAQGLEPATLVQARLAPDMYPLAGQVQSASDAAKFGAARLAGIVPPRFEDNETSFEELQARIARTLEFLSTLQPAQIDGSEGKSIVLKVGGRELPFEGQPYLLGFVLPNFFFHVTTAYAILRHQGVALGKRDFLGQV
ncbi:hypothetical protein GCM10007320_36500 [Pseudorhodoferax aquiterrae]|uniref:DUF1993 domain-containing protein n=1 Tax=Pseudorhodoferax aquiterrae TaxID=747304 RepID=A0ABQ3G4A7_9BURK|nr:DUF1993 domain-containing protein [Pseudorhodoferax aquiterrae]GHC89048.1 hypothetical protein GCM10007320_36500 [Pseudorhodoferax aquiterrae]